MDYNLLMQRITKQVGFVPKQADLCRIIAITPTTMAQRKARNSDFSDQEIRKLEEHYGITLMAHSTPQSSCVTLDYYPDVYGSCGCGSMIFSESKEKITVPIDLIPNMSTVHKYTVINARGLSMYPLICDMDRLIVRQYDGEQIIDNEVYVFTYNNELFIKRLVKNIDQVVVISENKEFENRVIIPDENNFKIIGKVVGLFREKV